MLAALNVMTLILPRPFKFVKCWHFFGVEFERTVSTKSGIWHFQVVVVQRQQRNVDKTAPVLHVQSCCFANLNLLLLCRSRSRRRRRILRAIYTYS